MNTYAIILGTHARLATAELEAVLSSLIIPYLSVKSNNGIAFLETEQPLDADRLMSRLGGAIKCVEVVGEFEEEAMYSWLLDQIDHSTKFHFGLSLYATEPGIPTKKEWTTLHKTGMSLKRALKQEGISCRYVQSQDTVLSSVIVRKERLLKNGAEIVLLKGARSLQYGKTLATQDYGEFAKRDYDRPRADAKSGMLPPKVARMIVNLARPSEGDVILDPFCGSGTILGEAYDLGFTNIIGSDISDRAIMDTRDNMEWMGCKDLPLYESPAQELLKRGHLQEESVDRIVFEGYLGTPRPRREDIPALKKELDVLYAEAFSVLAKLLREGGRIVAALPHWVDTDTTIDVDSAIAGTGLQKQDRTFLYGRDRASVKRNIVLLEK